MVGDFTEMLGRQHRVAESIQDVGVYLVDGVDQLVEADGMRDGCRVRGRFSHAVNCRLTLSLRQLWVDASPRRFSLSSSRGARCDPRCPGMHAMRVQR